MMYVNVFGEIENLEVDNPTVQASGIAYDGTNLSWTRGDGEFCLVVISSRQIKFSPFQNKTYPVNTYADGFTFVVFRGDGNSIELDLNVGRTYFVRVFEFNGKASTEKYGLSLSGSVTPEPEGEGLLNLDGTPLLNLDGTPLFNLS